VLHFSLVVASLMVIFSPKMENAHIHASQKGMEGCL